MGSFADYLERKLLSLNWGGTSYTPPATHYLAALLGATWAASHAYTSGDYVVPTTPNGRVYKCTTSGTSGSSEPTWPTSAAGTVTDGTAVFTEQSTAMDAGTLPAEPSGGAYARAAVTNNTTNFPAASGALATIALGADVLFAQATADWGTVIAIADFDAASGGNLHGWGALAVVKQIQNGDQLKLPSGSGLTLTLD